MQHMIQIRHVPSEVHKALKVRALEAGQSLSDYLRTELTRLVEKPALPEMLARLATLPEHGELEDPVTIVRAAREGRHEW
ncbi:MAG: FitA-like ribbon-helix-helix domain-containing protein [Polyangiales bacterium]